MQYGINDLLIAAGKSGTSTAKEVTGKKVNYGPIFPVRLDSAVAFYKPSSGKSEGNNIYHRALTVH
jgi:hypothetical protein